MAADKAGPTKGIAAPSAETLNTQHQMHLGAAGRLLTDAEFEDVFGIAKGQIKDVQLVNPEIFGGEEGLNWFGFQRRACDRRNQDQNG